jgi:hypothetical protein
MLPGGVKPGQGELWIDPTEQTRLGDFDPDPA